MANSPHRKIALHNKVLLVLGAILVFILGVIVALKWTSSSYDTNLSGLKTKKTTYDTIQTSKSTFQIVDKSDVEIKQLNPVIEEKMNGLNSRISDMYTTMTIIVPVVLFSLVIVYYKNKAEVLQYMEESFDDNHKKITEIVSDAETLLIQINEIKDLAHKPKNDTGTPDSQEDGSTSKDDNSNPPTPPPTNT